MFPTTCTTSTSLSEPARAGDRYTIPARSPSVGIPSKAGTLGGTLPLGPKSLKVKRQAFPHNGSTGLKRPIPASPPVTDNHHGAGANGATGCGR